MSKYLIKDKGRFKLVELGRAVLYLEGAGYKLSEEQTIRAIDGWVYVNSDSDLVSVDALGVRVSDKTRLEVVAGLVNVLNADCFKEEGVVHPVSELAA